MFRILFFGILLIIVGCRFQKNSQTTQANIEVDKKMYKVRSWDVPNAEVNQKFRNHPIDTFITVYDSLGKTIFQDMKFHPKSDRSFSIHGYKGIRDSNDSLTHLIRLMWDDRKENVLEDTVLYMRDINSRLELKIETNKYDTIKTFYEYDDSNRFTRITEKTNDLRIDKEWIFQYDGEDTCLKTKNVYKSGGYSLLFTVVDTITYNRDSTMIRIADYNSNTFGNKYRNTVKCSNCIKYIKKDANGNLLEETRIVRPNDTIYHEVVKYDRYKNPISVHLESVKDTSSWEYVNTYDVHGNYVISKAYRDSILISTQYRDIEYF
jgi:hypothetical protein